MHVVGSRTPPTAEQAFHVLPRFDFVIPGTKRLVRNIPFFLPFSAAADVNGCGVHLTFDLEFPRALDKRPASLGNFRPVARRLERYSASVHTAYHGIRRYKVSTGEEKSSHKTIKRSNPIWPTG